MTKNIIDKIWDAHVVKSEKGAPDVFFIDTQLLHEVTSPQAFDMIRNEGLKVKFPERNFATIDHSIPTKKDRTDYADEQAKIQVEKIRTNCKEFGIELFDVGKGQGVIHVIAPELGLPQPGKTIACGDSHTSTHGAFGALAFGIGTTQVSHVLTTQTILFDRPKTMKVEFVGKPTEHFTAKDAALAFIAQVGIQGCNGHAVEFCGEYIRNLSMEERMTICNLSIEAGARFGVMSPDGITYNYLKGRRFVGENFDELKESWKKWASDKDAEYDAYVEVDLAGKSPMVTWGTNPEQGITVTETIPKFSDFEDPAKRRAAEKALEYNGLKEGTPIKDTPIDMVFVGSCTNGRIQDFREVAKILEGKKVAEGVKVYLVPGSELVRAQCLEEGLDKIFERAGADFRMSGCSMCLAMNGDFVPVGKRCASTSNRNFVGRQGPGSFTHLMSPKMAAIAAITGKITDPEEFFRV